MRKGDIESSDRRVRYTKMVLRQSFLELIAVKPIERISVTEICKKADVNRGTFYAYYKDASDLNEQIKKNLASEIQKPLEKVSSLETLHDALIQIFETVRENKELCTLILSGRGDKALINGIANLVRETFHKIWKDKMHLLTQRMIDYLFAFTVYGTIGILEAWLAAGSESETPEKLAFMVEEMTFSVLERFAKTESPSAQA